MISKIYNYIDGLKYKYSDYGILHYDYSPILTEEKLNENLNKARWTLENNGFDKYGSDGIGIKIAVIDTGIDPFHLEFNNKIVPLNFTEDTNKNFPEYYDNNGHGTFVASLLIANKNLKGIVPRSAIYSMKVIGSVNPPLHKLEVNISNAINKAIDLKCEIITISIGFPHKSLLLEKTINKAVNEGILIFAASGNEGLYGSKYKSYPASYSNVISVAAADENGLPRWFSTSGLGEDPLTQPEVAISSPSYFIGALPGNNYGKFFGTSFSCPIMAGIGAKWTKQYGKKDKSNLKNFRNWIKGNVIDSNNNGWDNSLGYGIIKLNEKSF